jgi:pantetheine-phosphate adenylyltransferase
MRLNEIAERLLSLGFPNEVLDNYRQSHRFYHNTDHLVQILDYLKGHETLTDDLFLAAVYHDAIYDPKSDQNEAESAKLFTTHALTAGLENSRTENISRYILDTKQHKASDEVSQELINADLDILNKPLQNQIEFEKKIFSEYQFIDVEAYKNERLAILEAYNDNGRLNALIAYVKQRKPFVGLFCGSFNPFHKGHYNILQKAEKIFDKVIIAFGKNPDKGERAWQIPDTIKNRQLGEYRGLLTDYVASLGHEVVVIRGLRNSTDFQYEQNQYRYIQELMPSINIISIFCDKEFEHISSSGIRTLEEFGKHHQYLLK